MTKIQIADIIQGCNRKISNCVSWLVLVMVLVQFFIVLFRYIFHTGNIWSQESIIYLHGIIIMLAAAFTLAVDGHVRVDIIYSKLNITNKARVNFFGTIFFLFPFCFLLIIESYPYVINSWFIFERSIETRGIPLVFFLKTMIIIFPILLLLQGIATLLRNYDTAFIETENNRKAK